MPGRPATDHQVRLYMDFRRHHPQRIAAARSGLSERTGRRIESDPRLPSQKAAERPLRRQTVDPLGGLWESDILPLLASRPGLRPVTLLDEMESRHPDRDWDRLRRTWSAACARGAPSTAPEREVIFRQDHPPGQQGLSDFTDMADLGVGIAGEPLVHRLYHFVLAYSGWEHAEVVLGGESFTALASGLQNALWASAALRRAPLRQPSAAFRNLDRDAAEDQTRRYEALCAHYRMTATRNNLGVAHENGAIESQHGHLKRAVGQALLLRGSADFDSLDAYRDWIADLVGRRNARRDKLVGIERARLQAAAATAHHRPRRGHRGGHLQQRLHAAPRILHRPVAADRLSAEAADLRRPAGMLPRPAAGADPAARPRAGRWSAYPGRRLPPRHPQPAPQADGAAEPGLSRRAVPAPGLPRGLGAADRWRRRRARLPDHGRPARARP